MKPMYTKPITGTWFEFRHHNTKEGVYWNDTLQNFTEEQWRAKLREMKEAGVRGRLGKEIKYPQIYEILRNEKYAGIYVYSLEGCRHRKEREESENIIRIDGGIPAIVDKNTFDEVQNHGFTETMRKKAERISLQRTCLLQVRSKDARPPLPEPAR